MSQAAQTCRMREALQEIIDTTKVFMDINVTNPALIRVTKLAKAALQKKPSKNTSAIWKMMRWQSK